MNARIDRASRIVAASSMVIYGAFIDPDRQACWLPPPGMTARFEIFEPRAGGRYRMVLTYDDGGAAHSGKSTTNADIVEGHFVTLQPGARIVQTADFTSEDTDFAGTMTMVWTLRPVAGGTDVTIEAHDVPRGISAKDHRAGLTATLANLAAFVA